MIAVKALPTLASFLLLATPGAVATAGSLQITPRGIDCVTADRFPRIDALLTPPDQVSLARVLFRSKDSEGWYWVRMDHEGDRFVAALPKPGKGLKDFRYYIEATDTEFETSQTPEFEPQVVVDPDACRGKMVASTVASAKVIMHVPTGYKVPPVPGGFSVRGTLRAGEERLGVFPHMSLTTALLAAGVVGAGAVAVGLSVANPGPAVGVPGTLVPVVHGRLTLLASSPPPGSTISLSTGSLALSLRVTTDRDVPAGDVVVELWTPTSVCATFSSPHTGFRASTPQDITVSGPLFEQPTCGSSFSTNRVDAAVEGSDGTSVAGIFFVNFSFVP